MLNLLCSFLRMEDLPVVRLKLLWTMNWTWTDPVTIGPPSAGQRVTRAACNRPQLSFPIQMFLLQKTNEKSLTSQLVCNVECRKGFSGILSAAGLIRDGKLRFWGFIFVCFCKYLAIRVAAVPCSVCNEIPWVRLQTRISHLMRVVNNRWTLNSVCPLWKGVCVLWGLVGVLMMPSFLHLFHESDWICLEGGNERANEGVEERKKKERAGEGLGNAARLIR